MIRTSGQHRVGIAPHCVKPQSAGSKIVGGFVLVEVTWLIAAWNACHSAPMGTGDFRTLLAAREMVARRCRLPDNCEPAYGLAELARLLGVARKRAAASLRRLEGAGLIQWHESAIAFPEIIADPEQQTFDSIGRGKGSLAIPRRILRFLAHGARPAIIAAVLGILLRCLSRRKDGFDGRGRVKSSWIARLFGIATRRAKQARAILISLGWIYPVPSDQLAMNRWGGLYRIDLGWTQPGRPGRNLAPPDALDRPPIGTPSVNQEPLQEEIQNQEPARRDGPDRETGVEIQEQGTRMPGPVPVDLSRSEIEPIPGSPAARAAASVDLPAAKLDDVRIEDLKDTERLLELHGQAVTKGLVSPSEADQLRFVAAAEHAVAIGKGNPAGLFAYLIRGACWRYLTQADEDRANARIKGHLRGLEPVEVNLSQPFLPKDLRRLKTTRFDGLSEDARIVREVRAAMIQAGFYRDPWPLFQARNLGWDRARWDRALRDLGLA